MIAITTITGAARRKAGHTLRSEQGFTLIELLVVILVIGILAAIALPSFLDQRHKAEDANAKSNVRNMLSQMEVCYTERDGYVGCQAALTTVRTGLPIGGGDGQVEVESETFDSYSVIAHSKSGNWFRISNGPAGIQHECGVADVGACPSTGSW